MDGQDGIDRDAEFTAVVDGDVFVGGSVTAGVFPILPLAGAFASGGALGIWEAEGTGSASGHGSLTDCFWGAGGVGYGAF